MTVSKFSTTLFVFFIHCSIRVIGQESEMVLPIAYVDAINYGGKAEFKRFIQQEMNYPEQAFTRKNEGTVELAFMIDTKTGQPNNFGIRKSITPELDLEAVRLCNKLLFIPTSNNNSRVKTLNTLKFKFSIKNYKRFCKKRGYGRVEVDALVTDTSNIIYQDHDVKFGPKMVFNDTLDNISSFIYKNLKYPEGTLKLGITGVVELFFVVEPNGKITNIKTLKDVGGGATNEALRILKLTQWQAGKIDEKKVRVSKSFMVNFNLSNESGIDYVPNTSF